MNAAAQRLPRPAQRKRAEKHGRDRRLFQERAIYNPAAVLRDSRDNGFSYALWPSQRTWALVRTSAGVDSDCRGRVGCGGSGLHRAQSASEVPRSSSADDATLDDWTRKKLRRRIRLLEFFVAVYALVLVYGLSQTRSGPWLGLIAGMGFNVLMQVALIKAIRRLRKKLQVATGADLGSARPEPRT